MLKSSKRHLTKVTEALSGTKHYALKTNRRPVHGLGRGKKKRGTIIGNDPVQRIASRSINDGNTHLRLIHKMTMTAGRNDAIIVHRATMTMMAGRMSDMMMIGTAMTERIEVTGLAVHRSSPSIEAAVIRTNIGPHAHIETVAESIDDGTGLAPQKTSTKTMMRMTTAQICLWNQAADVSIEVRKINIASGNEIGHEIERETRTGGETATMIETTNMKRRTDHETKTGTESDPVEIEMKTTSEITKMINTAPHDEAVKTGTEIVSEIEIANMTPRRKTLNQLRHALLPHHSTHPPVPPQMASQFEALVRVNAETHPLLPLPPNPWLLLQGLGTSNLPKAPPQTAIGTGGIVEIISGHRA